MQPFVSESRPTEITVMVVIVALLILSPPILDLWGASDSPWYLPYGVWLGIIALSYLLQWILRRYAV
ncbi:MAG: hypothetical protein GY784_09450 [Gammaproteobacteria bacterium]|nr:hypothetical protein [Gammaproteobacteria bacterium]